MGVTVLPDWGPQLAQALAQLGSAVGTIANPYGEVREQFRRAAIANPKLIQNLADFTYENSYLPQSMVKLIPRDILDSIFAAEPSPEAYRRKQASLAAGKLSPEQATSIGQSELTGLAPTTAAIQLGQASLVPSVLQQAPGTEPTTLAEAGIQRTLGGLTAGQEAADRIKARLGPVAQQFLDRAKQYDAEHHTDFYQRMAADAFGLLDDEQYRMSMADRLLLMDERQQDRLEAIHEHAGIAWFNKSGGVGDPDLWVKLLYDPKTQKRVEEIRSTGPKTPEDRELLQMQSYREGRGQAMERADYMASVMTRDKMFEFINGNPAKRILPDDDTRRPGDIAALNAELARERTPFEAYWGPSPDGSGKVQLRFRSRQHKNVEATSEQVFAGLQQADRALSGANLQIQQPRPAGAAAPTPKPPAQVTSKPSDVSAQAMQARQEELIRQIRARTITLKDSMFAGKGTLTPAEINALKARLRTEFPGANIP